MAPARKKTKAKAKVKAKRKAGAKAGRKAKTKAGARKKAARKKTAVRKKVAKRPVKKAAKKRPPSGGTLSKRPPSVEPGPPTVTAPPVEEPAHQQEEAIGIVTHYYSHLSVAVVQVNKGMLRTGDRIRIKGHTTDLTQAVGSLEYEHQHVDAAEAGKSVGLKVADHVREHDIVYLIR
jgi:hypothetical protein